MSILVTCSISARALLFFPPFFRLLSRGLTLFSSNVITSDHFVAFLFFFSHHTHLPFVWFVFRRDKMRSTRKTSTKYIKLFMYGLRNRFVIISLVVVVGHDMNNSCTHPLPLVSPNLCIHYAFNLVGGDNFHIFTYVMLSKIFLLTHCSVNIVQTVYCIIAAK